MTTFGGEKRFGGLCWPLGHHDAAIASEEIRAQWGRLRYRLLLDDGLAVEIYRSATMPLGKPLLYFGSATNPRPGDPPFVLIDDLLPW